MIHPRVCLDKHSVCWMTSEGDFLYMSTFLMPLPRSQSISHLISALSRVDAADVVFGAYGQQDEGSAQT